MKGAAVLTAEVLGGNVCYATEVASSVLEGAATSVDDELKGELYYVTEVASPRNDCTTEVAPPGSFGATTSVVDLFYATEVASPVFFRSAYE